MGVCGGLARDECRKLHTVGAVSGGNAVLVRYPRGRERAGNGHAVYYATDPKYRDTGAGPGDPVGTADGTGLP